MADLRRRTSSIGILALALLVPACTTPGGRTSGGDRTGCLTTTVGSVPKGTAAHRVDDLGISFLLPEAYRPASDPELAFSARSVAPRGVFSIDGPTDELGPPPDREGETSAPLDLGCVEGFTISNAAISDLPPGIVANELVVNDGDRSFSVIMSTDQEDLDAAWSTFVDSLVVSDG